MRRRKQTYWTRERLKDLLRSYPKLSPRELLQKYERPLDEIYRAYDFALNHKRLLLRVERVPGKKTQRAYTITTYAPGYATGYTAQNQEETEE